MQIEGEFFGHMDRGRMAAYPFNRVALLKLFRGRLTKPALRGRQNAMHGVGRQLIKMVRLSG